MIDLENILKTIGKNTWQDLQFLPEKLQKELAKIPLEGEAGGGLVSIQGTATGKVHTIQIDESLIPDSKMKKTVADLLVAAFNTLQEKAWKEAETFKKEQFLSMLPK